MSSVRLLMIAAVSTLTLAACASRGGGEAVETAPESGGIQTRAIRAAPEARQAANDSRPLSELNTPDAIAARETAIRNGTYSAPAKRPTPAQPRAAGAVAAPAAAASAVSAAAATKPALQKGSTVRVRAGAILRARPAVTSEAASTTPLSTEVVLGAQIYNAGGYWWYVTAGKDSGWLLQTDIAP